MHGVDIKGKKEAESSNIRFQSFMSWKENLQKEKKIERERRGGGIFACGQAWKGREQYSARLKEFLISSYLTKRGSCLVFRLAYSCLSPDNQYKGKTVYANKEGFIVQNLMGLSDAHT